MNINMKKIYKVLCYFGLLFIVGLIAKPRSRSVRFHANQGLALFLTEIVSSIVLTLLDLVLGLIPVVGGLISALLSLAVGVVILLFTIYGIRNALTGQEKELPYIGQIHIIR